MWFISKTSQQPLMADENSKKMRYPCYMTKYFGGWEQWKKHIWTGAYEDMVIKVEEIIFSIFIFHISKLRVKETMIQFEWLRSYLLSSAEQSFSNFNIFLYPGKFELLLSYLGSKIMGKFHKYVKCGSFS